MDYGAFKFKKAKAAREAKKSQTKIEIREIRLTPRTADHDLNIKVKKIQEFLADGDKVLVSVKFRGREKAHTSLGKEMLEKIITLIPEGVVVESAPKLDGDNKMMMTLSAKRYNKDEVKAEAKQA